jgi:hypothetical protein
MEGPKDRLSRKNRRTPSSRRTRGPLQDGPVDPLGEVDAELTAEEAEAESTLHLQPEERQIREKLLVAQESAELSAESPFNSDDSMSVDAVDEMLRHEENGVSG